jgi:hypothetical protein
MQITKDFLEQEVKELETELAKAQSFVTQSQAVIGAYKMLLRRLDTEESQDTTDV